MEVVSIKFEENLLEGVEKAMKRHNYATKAEFVREAIREKLNSLEKQEYMMRVLRFYGAGKKKYGHITDADVHKAREMAARELARELGVDLE